MCVCVVFVREREGGCMNVCVRERGRVYECVCEREREGGCMNVVC